MKKVFTIFLAGFMLVLTACRGKGEYEDVGLIIPQITVQSDSINEVGKLLTETAANKQPNNPLGSNQSPALRWEAVEGTTYYAVCIFDESANWLHFLVTDIKKTSLRQGEYTTNNVYVGPYPPKDTGRHQYRMEVFALKQEPDSMSGKADTKSAYSEIIKSLDHAKGVGGNIIARGYLIGIYENGDYTVKDYSKYP